MKWLKIQSVFLKVIYSVNDLFTDALLSSECFKLLADVLSEGHTGDEIEQFIGVSSYPVGNKFP